MGLSGAALLVMPNRRSRKARASSIEA